MQTKEEAIIFGLNAKLCTTIFSLLIMASSSIARAQEPFDPNAKFNSRVVQRSNDLPVCNSTFENEYIAKQQKREQQLKSLERSTSRARDLFNADDKLAALNQLKDSEQLANDLLDNEPGELAIYYTNLSQLCKSTGAILDAEKYQKQATALITKVQPAGGAAQPSWNLAILNNYVVNVKDNGMLSTDGAIRSTPSQVDQLFANVEQVHNNWLNTKKTHQRDLVIYMHGGMVDEQSALNNTERHLDWWLNNQIYPIYLVWHTGIGDTLSDLVPILKVPPKTTSLAPKRLPEPTNAPQLPSRPTSIKQTQIADRRSALSLFPVNQTIELIASGLRSAWEDMKSKALQASSAIPQLDWSRPSSIDQNLPGGSVLVSRLKEYKQKYPDTKIHLVGHSAGSLYTAGLLFALKRAGLKADTVTLMAPAIRNNSFQQYFGTQSDNIGKLTIFNMDDERERADFCKLGPLIYQGSLLYLVARGFEATTVDDIKKYKGEVPLVGMAKYNSLPLCVACDPISSILERCKGRIYYAPNTSPPTGSTNADSHHAFSDDTATFDSIARIITNRSNVVSYDHQSER